MVEGARLESVYRGNSIEGSNPSLSASYQNWIRRRRSPWDFYRFQSSKVSIPQTAPAATSATRPLPTRFLQHQVQKLALLFYCLPIFRLHGAGAPFFSRAGQLTITFSGSGLAATSLTSMRWPSGATS